MTMPEQLTRAASNGHDPDLTPRPPGTLPEEFWSARPLLEHIRLAAWARGRSAEAVLGVVLARTAADAPYFVRLPTVVGAPTGLSLTVAVTGPPGAGKSSAAAIAYDLIPRLLLKPEADNVPPGSGEGLVDVLFDSVREEHGPNKNTRVKRQTRHNAFVYADEGEVLAMLAKRQGGSTLLSTLRTIFTGGTIGQANVSGDSRRVTREYSFGVVIAVQPVKCGPLFEDAAAGTPQRLLWVSSATPCPGWGKRPPWPDKLKRRLPPPVDADPSGIVTMTMHPDVIDEIGRNDDHRRQHGSAPLEEHADLVRLKVAGLLAVLDESYHIGPDDWALAGMVLDASRETRTDAQLAVREDAAQRRRADRDHAVDKAVASDAAIERRRTEDAARKIGRKVFDAVRRDEVLTVALLRRDMRRYREVFDDALDHAKHEGWVAEKTEPGQGQTKRVLVPAGATP